MPQSGVLRLCMHREDGLFEHHDSSMFSWKADSLVFNFQCCNHYRANRAVWFCASGFETSCHTPYLNDSQDTIASWINRSFPLFVRSPVSERKIKIKKREIKKKKNLPASRHNGCCFCISAYYRSDTYCPVINLYWYPLLYYRWHCRPVRFLSNY